MPRTTRLVLPILAIVTACVRTTSTTSAPASVPWTQYVNVADAGFSPHVLDSVRAYADSSRAAAVMVVHRGRVVAAWGDVERKFQLHSVRKSLLSALYGIGVESGKIRLDATLADLGIDDLGVLTAQEKTARVRDLIAARSGVYLTGAYGGTDQIDGRPARGAHAPGTRWFYNNWDFNLAGVLYERFMGESLYVSFARRIAAPIGMEDYTPDDGFQVLEPSSSIYPAHTFRLSTRDLARFGQLYLQRGQWNGEQVVPARWVAESTTPISSGRADGFREGSGYGFMWWTYAPGSHGTALPLLNALHASVASGTGGQTVYVIPNEEIVIVIRGDTDNGQGLSGGGRPARIAEGVLRAKRAGGAPVASPALGPLAPVAVASAKPAPPPPRLIAINAAARGQYVGSYRAGGKEVARVFIYQNRMFGSVPGLGDAELFATGPDEFTVRFQSGVRVSFTRNEAGAVRSARLDLGGGRTIVGERAP